MLENEIKALTENQKEWFMSAIKELIDEHDVAASNEHIWASGSKETEEELQHSENAEEQEQFVDFLAKLLFFVQNS